MIELRLVNEFEQMQKPVITDVTFRRLQNFKVLSEKSKPYYWMIENEGSIMASGQISPNGKGLLTVNNAEIGLAPIRLTIKLQQ